MATNIENVLKELSKPFHPSHISWKPGAFSRDKTKALGMAYADMRAYQNRLDEVCGMEWSVSYMPWGDRIVCQLTIFGVTRSSTGEADSRSEKSEIAGTAAESQAFKRACAMFSLGRYLYNLPTIWAEFDEKSRGFSEQGKARLNGIIVQHYRRNVDDEESEPVQPAQSAQKPTNGNGNGHKPPTADNPFLPFAETHEAAVDWGFEQGCFNALKHAQNAYKELARLHGWTTKEDSKITTPKLFQLWVTEVENRVAEHNKQRQAA